MPFTSLVFLFLFLPFLLLSFLLFLPKLKKPLLLLASLVFYGWAGISFIFIFIAYILFNYISGIFTSGSSSQSIRKIWLFAGIVLNVLGLVVFKYTTFFETNFSVLASVFRLNPIHTANIIIPLGISFIALRGISYLLAVYRKETQARRSITDLGLYLGFFPVLFAGPIDRYSLIEPQLSSPLTTMDLFASGVGRFLLGLAKKLIIAVPLASAADQIFGMVASEMNTPLAWLGIVAFALQIYYEFSSYTDMAIGLGRMFGFRFSENFDFPYTSRSVRDFWERWNTTVNAWFREYIFGNLSAPGKNRTLESPETGFSRPASEKPFQSLVSAAAILFTLLLWGAWYGAGWNFLLFGLVFGLFLLLETTGFGRLLDKGPAVTARIYTLFVILMAWVIFRSPDIKHALQFYRILFGLEASATGSGRVSSYFSRELILSLSLAVLGCTKFFLIISTKAGSILTNQFKQPISRLVSVGFMIVLLVPFLLDNLVGGPKPRLTPEEVRATAPRPSLSISTLNTYPERFSKFYDDHLPYRDKIMNWWSEHYNVALLKKAPLKSPVDMGDEGWMYPAGERPVYEGNLMLSTQDIELIHQTIRNRVIFYRANGIRLYVFFVPMKSVIYPEHLPSYYVHFSDSTQTQKVISLLSRDTLIPFIDVNPGIINAKPSGTLFTHTGKSWNTKGAFEAYRQIISRIRKDFPSITPIEPTDVRFDAWDTTGGALATELGIQHEVSETLFRPVIANARAVTGKKAGHSPPPWFDLPKEFEKVSLVPDSSLPKALVIRDPYFTPMIPFFGQNFRKTVYIFDAWMYDLNWDIIQKEKPDVVLLEVYEPNIKNIIHK